LTDNPSSWTEQKPSVERFGYRQGIAKSLSLGGGPGVGPFHNNPQPEGGIPMKKIQFLAIIATALATFSATNLAAKTYRIKLPTDATVSGQTLKAGSYKVEVNSDNEATIYSGRNLVLSTKVQLESLGSSRPNSTLINGKGVLEEVRFGKQKLLFVEGAPTAASMQSESGQRRQ
jgi:hypothetical protein